MYSLFQTSFIVIGILFFMTACGGGGGGDSEENPPQKAVIDTSNEEQLATAATEAVIQSFEGFALADKTISAMLDNLTCSSGTVENNYNVTAGSGNITFNQCDAEGFDLVGTVYISASRSGDIFTSSYIANNFTFNSSSKNLSFVCETIISNDETSCIYSSINLGLDGRSYTVSNATVSKDFISITVSAKVIDPDHGIISISTKSPVILICNGLKPGSGEIQFTDDDGKIVTVIYDNCSSYTISYSGVSNSYNW